MFVLQPGATSAATRVDFVGASPLHVKVSRRGFPFGSGVSRIRKEVVSAVWRASTGAGGTEDPREAAAAFDVPHVPRRRLTSTGMQVSATDLGLQPIATSDVSRGRQQDSLFGATLRAAPVPLEEHARGPISVGPPSRRGAASRSPPRLLVRLSPVPRSAAPESVPRATGDFLRPILEIVNGNTLITSGPTRRIFEVTKGGRHRVGVRLARLRREQPELDLSRLPHSLLVDSATSGAGGAKDDASIAGGLPRLVSESSARSVPRRHQAYQCVSDPSSRRCVAPGAPSVTASTNASWRSSTVTPSPGRSFGHTLPLRHSRNSGR